MSVRNVIYLQKHQFIIKIKEIFALKTEVEDKNIK